VGMSTLLPIRDPDLVLCFDAEGSFLSLSRLDSLSDSDYNLRGS